MHAPHIEHPIQPAGYVDVDGLGPMMLPAVGFEPPAPTLVDLEPIQDQEHVNGVGPMALRSVGMRSPTPTMVDMGPSVPSHVERAEALVTPVQAARELVRAWGSQHAELLRGGMTIQREAPDPRDGKVVVAGKLKGLWQHEQKIASGVIPQGTLPDRSLMLTVEQAAEAAQAPRIDMSRYAARRGADLKRTPDGQIIGRPDLMTTQEKALAKRAAELAMRYSFPETSY
jgi:hypothetical protein